MIVSKEILLEESKTRLSFIFLLNQKMTSDHTKSATLIVYQNASQLSFPYFYLVGSKLNLPRAVVEESILVQDVKGNGIPFLFTPSPLASPTVKESMVGKKVAVGSNGVEIIGEVLSFLGSEISLNVNGQINIFTRFDYLRSLAPVATLPNITILPSTSQLQEKVPYGLTTNVNFLMRDIYWEPYLNVTLEEEGSFHKKTNNLMEKMELTVEVIARLHNEVTTLMTNLILVANKVKLPDQNSFESKSRSVSAQRAISNETLRQGSNNEVGNTTSGSFSDIMSYKLGYGTLPESGDGFLNFKVDSFTTTGVKVYLIDSREDKNLAPYAYRFKTNAYLPRTNANIYLGSKEKKAGSDSHFSGRDCNFSTLNIPSSFTRSSVFINTSTISESNKGSEIDLHLGRSSLVSFVNTRTVSDINENQIPAYNPSQGFNPESKSVLVAKVTGVTGVTGVTKVTEANKEKSEPKQCETTIQTEITNLDSQPAFVILRHYVGKEKIRSSAEYNLNSGYMEIALKVKPGASEIFKITVLSNKACQNDLYF